MASGYAATFVNPWSDENSIGLVDVSLPGPKLRSFTHCGKGFHDCGRQTGVWGGRDLFSQCEKALTPTTLGPKKLWFNNFVWKVLSPECWVKSYLTSKKFYRLPRKREQVGCGVEELHWHMVAHRAPVIIAYRFLYYHLNYNL